MLLQTNALLNLMVVTLAIECQDPIFGLVRICIARGTSQSTVWNTTQRRKTPSMINVLSNMMAVTPVAENQFQMHGLVRKCFA